MSISQINSMSSVHTLFTWVQLQKKTAPANRRKSWRINNLQMNIASNSGGNYGLMMCIFSPVPHARGRSSPFTAIYDLGTLAPGQNIAKVVEVCNRFPGPLIVRGIYSSCGCTSVKLMYSVILPHGHCALHIHVTARIWPGPEGVQIAVVGKVGATAHAIKYLVRYEVKNFVSFPGASYYVNLGTINDSALPRWVALRIRRGGQSDAVGRDAVHGFRPVG